MSFQVNPKSVFIKEGIVMAKMSIRQRIANPFKKLFAWTRRAVKLPTRFRKPKAS